MSANLAHERAAVLRTWARDRESDAHGNEPSGGDEQKHDPDGRHAWKLHEDPSDLDF
jgi:hypothetical protein